MLLIKRKRKKGALRYSDVDNFFVYLNNIREMLNIYKVQRKTFMGQTYKFKKINLLGEVIVATLVIFFKVKENWHVMLPKILRFSLNNLNKTLTATPLCP